MSNKDRCRRTTAFSAFLQCLLIALLSACGSESHKTEIDLNGHAIVWTGYADADQNLKNKFDETVVCLTRHSLMTRPGYAFIIVIDGSFKCNGVLARGCAELSGKSIYMDKEYLYTSVFNHEVIHWETGMGNEFHNSAEFNYCTTSDAMTYKTASRPGTAGREASVHRTGIEGRNTDIRRSRPGVVLLENNLSNTAVRRHFVSHNTWNEELSWTCLARSRTTQQPSE